jgi:hypothetical protein
MFDGPRACTARLSEWSGVYIRTFRVRNFRRLREVGIDLDPETTIFVGANNSGKTSAAQVFRLFLGEGKGRFQLYDFTPDCWDEFDAFDTVSGDPDKLPRIELDIWMVNIHPLWGGCQNRRMLAAGGVQGFPAMASRSAVMALMPCLTAVDR